MSQLQGEVSRNGEKYTKSYWKGDDGIRHSTRRQSKYDMSMTIQLHCAICTHFQLARINSTLCALSVRIVFCLLLSFASDRTVHASSTHLRMVSRALIPFPMNFASVFTYSSRADTQHWM